MPNVVAAFCRELVEHLVHIKDDNSRRETMMRRRARILILHSVADVLSKRSSQLGPAFTSKPSALITCGSKFSTKSSRDLARASPVCLK